MGEGFIGGVEANIVVSAIDGTTGHVTARPREYPTEVMQHPIDELLTLTPEAKKFLDERVTAWAPRIYMIPTATHESENLRVRAIGYDPERDPTVFKRHLWKLEGEMPRAERDEVMVSPVVAQNLKLEPGDRLVLQLRTHTGAINAMEVTVSAVVRTTYTTIDSSAILVPGPLAARLANTTKWSHISMLASFRAEGLTLADEFAASFGEAAEVITWDSETEELLRLQGIRRRALNFIVGILLALAGFGMANTSLMAAYERVKEVGTLRAMGMTKLGVIRMFLAEGAVMGLVGSLLGVLWGGWLTYHWAHNPIDMTEAANRMEGGIQYSALIYTDFSSGMVVMAVIFGVVVATLASIYPARVASRMLPADAVRA